MTTQIRFAGALAVLCLAPLAAVAASTDAPAPIAAKPAPAKPATARAASAKTATSKSATTKAATPAGAKSHKSRFPIGGMPDSARGYYADLYGIDDMSARLTESGQLVRFSYHVVNAAKAKQMMDRAAEPALQDEVAHVSLSIPVMDKVGPLRQSMGAVEGTSYWMAFSNKGGPVKAGHKVSVVIGPVRIDGLVVE
jgi:hypothetical protein